MKYNIKKHERDTQDQLLHKHARIGTLQHLIFIFFQETKIFPGFTEFTFFHTFTDVPMDISTLRVHHIVFFTESFSEDSVDSNIITNHSTVTGSFGHVISYDSSGWSIIKTNLETSWTPFDKGYFSLLFHPLDGGVGNFRFNITSVVNRDGHIFIFDNVKVRVFD